MKQFHYAYKKFTLPDSQGKLTSIYRPIIPITISIGDASLVSAAVIDSGADYCTFPKWVLRNLGVHLKSGPRDSVRGLTEKVDTYIHKTMLKIETVEFEIDGYYIDKNMPYCLLGQNGFFSFFNVNFEFQKKNIILTRIKH